MALTFRQKTDLDSYIKSLEVAKEERERIRGIWQSEKAAYAEYSNPIYDDTITTTEDVVIINKINLEPIGLIDLDQIPSKQLRRTFGRNNDSIELIIRDLNGGIKISDEQFTDYTPILDPTDPSLIRAMDINYKQVLNDYGFTNGTYKLTFSFQRKLLTQGNRKQFKITQISPF
mgnify:CR=1 FL=1